MTGSACSRLVTMTVALTLAAQLAAHGGNYRGGHYGGPRDTVGGKAPTRPPGAPKTPGPSTPSAPTPGGTNAPTTPGPGAPPPPTTGGPRAPAPGGMGPKTGPRGIQLGADLSQWQGWWDFNKDRFLNLKDSIHSKLPVTGSDEFYMGIRRKMDSNTSLKPSETDIQTVILPAIKSALDDTDNRDITSSCLMALAKIGRDHDSFEILPILRKHLVTHDQEIRETAALAIGLTQMKKGLPLLRELALDRALGRQLIARSKVDYRTRSFAIYGMALIAHAHDDLDVKRTVLDVADKILAQNKDRSSNVCVAAIQATGLLKIDGQTDKARALRDEAVNSLRRYFAKELGPQEHYMQAHVPGAVAKLIGRGTSAVHVQLKAELVAILSGKSKRKIGNNILRSAALALGQLAVPDKIDASAHNALIRFATRGKDAQARYFAMISMGQINAPDTRTSLLKIVAKGNKSIERPWAAMALGVSEFRMAKADPRWVPDKTIGDAIHKQFLAVRNPAARSGFAIALGLCRYQAAGADLLETLDRYRHQDEFAGFLCLGLALMDYRKALPVIHELVETSVRRPELLRQTAVALGKMGDKRVAVTLMAKLEQRDSNLAKLAATAAALGFIGDRRTIQPLKKMMGNEEFTKLTRAFAVVALGMVADKGRLPWNSKIGANINYRAVVETLTESGTGILDIL